MLEISGIYKSYHRQNILAGADLTVAPGECVGIVGYNGCGKTTLLSILAGARKRTGAVSYIMAGRRRAIRGYLRRRRLMCPRRILLWRN